MAEARGPGPGRGAGAGASRPPRTSRRARDRRGRRGRRSPWPWLALLLVLGGSGVAGGARWDVKDTHERLDKIYKDLGLDREEDEQGCAKGDRQERSQGCGGCEGCQPKKRCRMPAGKGKGGAGAGGGVVTGDGKGKAGGQGKADGKGKGDGKGQADGKGQGDGTGKGKAGGKGTGDGKGQAGDEDLPECEPSGPTPSMPAWLGYLLFGVIIAAMLIPLILVLRNSYRDKAQPLQADVELEEPAEPARQASGPWFVDLSECRRLFEQGRLAEAFASLHRLTLLNLERGRHLVLSETTTNWEYVRRLASKPALREALARVTQAAEQSVLGQRPPGPEHYEQLERLVVERLQEVRA